MIKRKKRKKRRYVLQNSTKVSSLPSTFSDVLFIQLCATNNKGFTYSLGELGYCDRALMLNCPQVRIVVSDFQPQGQPGLNQKLQQIVRDLAEIDKLRSV